MDYVREAERCGGGRGYPSRVEHFRRSQHGDEKCGRWSAALQIGAGLRALPPPSAGPSSGDRATAACCAALACATAQTCATR
eukprot:scaffold49_cov409-Prasinococcus_capsulatus_cf.AAC.35